MKQLLAILLLIISLLLISCSASHDIETGVYPTAVESEAAVKAQTVNSPQVLAPGDQLAIYVWRFENLQQSVTVDMNGNINITPVGEIHVQGMTTNELKNELTVRLKQYYKDPLVTVTQEKFASDEFYILGEIRDAGNKILEKKTTAFEAIISAGGFTDDAAGFLLLIRKEEKALRIIKASFDFASIKDGGFNSHNLIVARGDILYVPPSRRSKLEKFAQTLSTLLSPVMDVERMIVLWPSVVEALESKNDVTVAF